MAKLPNPSEAMLAREFSRCDPRVVRAIKNVHAALKPMAENVMSDELLLKKCVGIVAAFEYNCDQIRKKQSPIWLPPGGN